MGIRFLDLLSFEENPVFNKVPRGVFAGLNFQESTEDDGEGGGMNSETHK